jgi:hypothetical protein
MNSLYPSLVRVEGGLVWLHDGLFFALAAGEHVQMVGESKRKSKPCGTAFFVTVRGFLNHVDDQEWNVIPEVFAVQKRNAGPYQGDRWTFVAEKS